MELNNIKIFFKDYAITYESEIRDNDDNKLMGQIAYNELTIKILNNMPEIIQKQTLLHEITHGICNYLKIEIEEKEIDQLANGFLQVFIDNPDLLKLFIKPIINC